MLLEAFFPTRFERVARLSDRYRNQGPISVYTGVLGCPLVGRVCPTPINSRSRAADAGERFEA